jgi:hypothetical protein
MLVLNFAYLIKIIKKIIKFNSNKVRKHKNLITASKYEGLLEDMRAIHMSKDNNAYKKNLKSFEKKYKKESLEMYIYIRDQWLVSVFCNWQIFRNNPGFANTNSNLESFNATIKRDFTNGRVSHISGAIKKLGQMIEFYSAHAKSFEYCPKYNKKVLEMANSLTKSNFKHTDRYNVVYKGKSNTFNLHLNDASCYNKCNCDCTTFMKAAVCMHLVGFSNIFSKNLFGSAYSNDPKTFNFAKKRGAPKKTNRYGDIPRKIK